MHRVSSQSGEPPREAIVDKLHGALSVLRRERDELHRSKELALERYRLAKEEREAAEQRNKSLQQKYDEIESVDTKQKRQNDITALNAEVERLSREVRLVSFFIALCDTLLNANFYPSCTSQVKFQHAELVAKRDKMNSLKNKMAKDDANRNNQLRAAKEAVRVRREKIAKRQTYVDPADSMNAAEDLSDLRMQEVKAFLEENDNSNDLEFLFKIQRLLQQKCEDETSDLQAFQQEATMMQRRIKGYENYTEKQGITAIDMQDMDDANLGATVPTEVEQVA